MEKTPALLAFDMDGTVLNPVSRTISNRVQTALNDARQHNFKTCVASGRAQHMLGENLMHAPWIDIQILCNGAAIYETRTGKLIQSNPVPKSVVQQIFDTTRAFNPCWVMHFETGTVQDMRMLLSWAENDSIGDSRTTKDVETLKKIFPDIPIVDDVEKVMQTHAEEVFKFGCSLNTEEACQAMEQSIIDAHIPVEIARLTSKSLEITNKGVTKGSAIKSLCELLPANEQESVAFGDAGNDASMAQQAWTFVAMGNGQANIKAIADDICPSIADDGVAVWVEEHILNK